MTVERNIVANKTDAENAPEFESVADGAPSAREDSVGYRRPPIATRFGPGISGNPRGRPKGARGLSSVVAAALGERVAVTVNGKRKRITKLEAAVARLVNRAASGEARATQLLLALIQAQEARPAACEADHEVEADAIVMAELARRLRSNGP